MAQTGAPRLLSPICVHYCVPTVAGRRNSVHKCPKMTPRGPRDQSVYTPAAPRLLAVATVYTNGPKRCPMALITNLCTLLRPEAAHHPCATTVYTNGPKRCQEVLTTGFVYTIAARGCPPPLRHDSVHKWPKTMPRGPRDQSVYTPAAPVHT